LSGSYDAFVAKVNPSGSQLIYAISLAGSRDDIGTGIAVDGSHNAYIVGSTGSADFPTTPVSVQPAFGGGDSDAFVAKIADVAPTNLSLSAVKPNRGGDTGIVTIAVGGTGFVDGTTVKLVRSGQAEVVARSTVVLPGGSTLSAAFDLEGK